MSDRLGQSGDHDELRDDLAAYALGALEEPEAERLRAHLDGCEECRRRLRWLEPAVDLLPRTVEQLEPPARVRETLLETVRAEAPQEAREPHRAPHGSWWHKFGLAVRRPATAVAAVAMLVVGAVAGYLIGEPGGSGTSTLEAQAMPNAPHAHGTLAREGNAGILRVQGMPPLASNQVYEVWVERDAELEPSSLFVPRSDRSADAAVPAGLDGADAVLVTKEPRGGSRQPTSSPVLSVQVN
jgi:anti-sigma-K factor RskA/putative zinc finger protein